MSTLTEREEAFENRFAYDQEQIFKARARRTMKIAAWAAQQMGRSADETAAFVNEIVALDLLEGKDEPIINRIHQDLKNAGLESSKAEIGAKLGQLMEQAMADIKTPAKKV